MLINLSHRSPNHVDQAYGTNGATIGANSCYHTSTTQSGSLFILGIDLGQSYFQHIVFFMQNMFDSSGGSANDYFTSFKIYIGEDGSNYLNNVLCAGSPFYTVASSWRFGFDIYCNLQGRYMYIVRDSIDTSIYR